VDVTGAEVFVTVVATVVGVTDCDGVSRVSVVPVMPGVTVVTGEGTVVEVTGG